MPRFGRRSKSYLRTCDTRLINLFEEVVGTRDCSVRSGHRGEEEQNAAYNAKPRRSWLKWPQGKHNDYPSKAVDVYPYPIDMEDIPRFYVFAGYVQRVAEEMGIRVRWGGDWDGDRTTTDQKFNDLVHWEILE